MFSCVLFSLLFSAFSIIAFCIFSSNDVLSIISADIGLYSTSVATNAIITAHSCIARAISPFLYPKKTDNAIIAITIISTLIYDNYFCPKYHSKSYYLHELAIEQSSLFEPNLHYKYNKSNIYINSDIITSDIRKKYILSYVDA